MVQTMRYREQAEKILNVAPAANSMRSGQPARLPTSRDLAGGRPDLQVRLGLEIDEIAIVEDSTR